jgi:hypothetical protein
MRLYQFCQPMQRLDKIIVVSSMSRPNTLSLGQAVARQKTPTQDFRNVEVTQSVYR